MALTAEEVHQTMALEAEKREVAKAIARHDGQLQAARVAIATLSRLHSDTETVRADLVAKLQRLDTSRTPSDDFGKFSTVEKSAFDERLAGKSASYDFLVTNPTATFEEAVAAYEAAALAYRTGIGRPYLLQSGASLVRDWTANALERRLVPDAAWETFRDFLLSLGKDAALGLSG